ncbi:MAG TPA: DUF1259 domain-containing protein, partial [Symbiobacteriaceae bacterium]
SLATWDGVGKVLGRKGVIQGGVFRVTFPRRDLNVHIGSVRLDPALALTSWVAFHGTGPRSMMMGDLVLLDTETEPVMAKLVEGGLQVTALHNHLLHESPRVMFLHIAGEGDPLNLAERVKRALALTGTPPAEQQPGEPPRDARLDMVEKTFGRRGSRAGDVLQFSIPRPDTIAMNGIEIPPAMGVAHAINFQVAGNAVATTGDFVLLASEVNPVVRALTESGIAVTGVHNHMLEETPRVFFLHFWGVGRPDKIAQGVKDALAKTRSTGR